MTQNPLYVKGLCRDIAQSLLDSSVREYPDFAVATAMQAIAAASMGAFLLPDGRPLCLYQLLLAPASSGKGAYIGGLKNLLLKSGEQMLAGEPGSREGVRRLLLEWNARLFCIDEVQEFFQKLGDDNPHIKGIGTDLKEIWSGVHSLQSIATKASVTNTILSPLAGFIGTGTTSETAQYFSGAVSGGGLVSRFAVFFVDDVGQAKREQRCPEWEAEAGALRRLFNYGKTPEWKQRGFDDWLDYRKRLLDPKGCTPEGPQVKPRNRMTLDKDADDALWQQRQLWEQFILADCNSAEGSIWDRAATNALLYAALHAIGQQSNNIVMDDINVGIELARKAAENACALATKYGGDTAPDRDAKRILRALERGPLTKRELSRASHLTGRRFAEALGGLIAAQNVVPTMDKFLKC
jgi:hypothetical protein